MQTADDLDQQASELEDTIAELEVHGRLLTAQANLQKAHALRKQADRLRQREESLDQAPTSGIDQSLAVARALRGNELTQLPEENELAQVLLPSPEQRILVDSLTMQKCQADLEFGSCSQYLGTAERQSTLQQQLCSLLKSPLMTGGNQGLTMIVFGMFCNQLLLILETVLPSDQRTGLTFNDNSSNEDSTSDSVTIARARPDMVFICNHLLMLVAELGKAGDGGVLDAIKGLRKKLRKGLPASHYGELPYLPAVAQSGTRVQLCKVRRDGQVHEIGHAIDVMSLVGRVEYICIVSNLHRLLTQMSRSVADLADRLPLFLVMQCGDTSLECRTDCIRKCINPFPTGNQFDLTQQASQIGCANADMYLVRASQGPRLNGRRYTVYVQPIGFHAVPTTNQGVLLLVHDVSQALKLLHQADIVHMDVREANVVKLPPPASHHMLIDLESVGQAGANLAPGHTPLRSWDGYTLESGRFSAKSDMYLLGLMMGRLLDGLPGGRSFTPLSAHAQALHQALICPEAASRPTAAEVCASIMGALPF